MEDTVKVVVPQGPFTRAHLCYRVIHRNFYWQQMNLLSPVVFFLEHPVLLNLPQQKIHPVLLNLPQQKIY